MKEVLEALPSSIDHVWLPPKSRDNNLEGKHWKPNYSHHETFTPISSYVLKSLVATARLAAFVVDLFGTEALDVAKELNISRYIFFPVNAMVLSLLLHLPKRDETVSCEYKDLSEPLKLPGCIPIHGRDPIEPAQDRTSEYYKEIIRIGKQLRLTEGIMLINTFIN